MDRRGFIASLLGWVFGNIQGAVAAPAAAALTEGTAAPGAGPNAPPPDRLAAGNYRARGAGTLPRPVMDRLQTLPLQPQDFGPVDITGRTGCADRVEAALNSGQPVELPAGIYLIERPLRLSVSSFSLRGARDERGTNAMGLAGPGYHAVRLLYRPADPSMAMISIHREKANGAAIGPFLLEDIALDAGRANGIEIGRRSLDTQMVDGAGQAYIFRPVIRGCAFIGARATGESTQAGRLERSGQVLLSLTKAFEAVVEDCSFYGGDIQIDCFACDVPTISRVRSQGANLPLRLEGAGSFTVQARVDGFQCEGWALAAIQVSGAMAARITAIRLEMNNGAPFGEGRLPLPGTVAVKADSGILTFSQSMEGVLFAGLSVLELTDGNHTDHVLVQAVDGRTVTVITADLFRFTWSSPEARAVRIHGYGILNTGREVTLDGISPGAAHDCPWLVWVAGGEMAVSNCLAVPGSYGDIHAMVIGNRHGDQGKELQRRAVFSGVSPLLLPDPHHPLVHAVGATEGHDDNARAPVTASYDEGAVARWWLTPRNSITGVDHASRIIFHRIVVNGQAWYAYNIPAGDSVRLPARGLPRDAARRYRMLVKCRAQGQTAQVSLAAVSHSARVGLGDRSVGSAITVLTYLFQAPASWSSAGSGVNAVLVGASGGALDLIGVEIIDETDLRMADPAEDPTSGRASRRLEVEPGMAAEMFQIPVPATGAAGIARIDLTATPKENSAGPIACHSYELAFGSRAGLPVVLGLRSMRESAYGLDAKSPEMDILLEAQPGPDAITLRVTVRFRAGQNDSRMLTLSGEVQIIGGGATMIITP